MKKFLLLTLILLTLTACAQAEAIPTPTITNTPVPPTATNTPEPTLTPTPMPYYLEDGSLYDLDEATGEYILVGEGLAAITTTAEGIVAVDADGLELFRYEDAMWVEVMRTADAVWGFVAPPGWGQEYLEFVRDWVNSKFEFPTELRGMTYTDGEPVPYGHILQNKVGKRNYTVVLADIFQMPEDIYNYNESEFQMLVLSPTDANDLTVGGDIISLRFHKVPRQYDMTMGLYITPDNTVERESYYWEGAMGFSVYGSDLVEFFQAALNGQAPAKGCQLFISTGFLEKQPNSWIGLNGVHSLIGNPDGDGVWKLGVPSNIAGSDGGFPYTGFMAIPESCMTDEMWAVLNSIKQ